MPPDLWSFALSCYARPGVEQTCLRLQDGGIDICLLLCALWLERRGVPGNAAYLAQLQAIAEPWQHQVVQPLRELRHGWKEAARHDPQRARLREQLKALELEAERELLARLHYLAQTWPGTGEPTYWLELLMDDHAALARLRSAANET